MEEFNLLKSEIKKVEKEANFRNNCKDCKVTGFYTTGAVNDYGFIEVICEICRDYVERRDNIVLLIYPNDRRKSFVSCQI